MNIKALFLDLARRMIPTKTILVQDTRHDPVSITSTLSVDRIIQIQRSMENGDLRDYFSVCRDMMTDAHLQNLVNTRKLGTLKDKPYFTAAEETPAGLTAKDLTARLWKATSQKREALTHLLDSALYPVAVVEKVFKPSSVPGARWELASLKKVPHHLLDFQMGRLRIEDIGPEGMPLGTFSEIDPMRHIVHRGNLMTSHPDKWGGPMRACLFWWLFKTQDRGWWIEFLARFGHPFIVGKYPDGRDDSRRLLQRAFAQSQRLHGMAVSEGTDIAVHAVQSSTHGDAFQAFAKFADEQLSKLVSGQVGTADAQASGLNSSQAEVHERVGAMLCDFDGEALGETIREQLFMPLLTLNGINPDLAPSITWGSEDPVSMEQTVKSLEALPKAGLRPKESALPVLSRRIGFEVERAPASPVLVPQQFSASGPVAREILVRESAATLPPVFREYHAAILRAGGDPVKTAEVIARIPYAARAAVLHESLVAFAASA